MRYGNLVRAFLLVGLLPFAACTELTYHRDTPTWTAPPAVPLAAIPQASHRFKFDAETDDVVGDIQIVRTNAGDTLPDIARRFNLGYDEIRRANPNVDTWLPGTGTEIVLPTQFVLPSAPRKGIVINLAAMRLYQFLPPDSAGSTEVITHPVGIGRVGWKTPIGITKVVRRVVGPRWHPPASIRAEHRELGEELPAVVPAGPDNPLGSHALYLAWPSYLIHGTDKPYGVGMRSSHGCIRLYPEDIVGVFESTPRGTPVTVVNQPYLLGRHGNDLLVQAWGALEDDPRHWQTELKTLLKQEMRAEVRARLQAQAATLDWAHVEHAVNAAHGIPVSALAPQNDLAALLKTARRVRNELPRGATWDGREIFSPAGANSTQQASQP